ncbi:hypothetical protein F5Y03DRAFT_339782 [Xylaria venustula]|nr:hypothetical protein F5Y03DRAFT_339782 [Xylaria venustula]
MQTIDKNCAIRCDIKGVRLHHPRVVYSTDPLACPTFLHMHDDNGYCIPDTISTSSLIIKHRAPVTNTWEYFYLTSDLSPPQGHGSDDTRKFRPMRLGKCVPVGMEINYSDDNNSKQFQEVIALVHIHRQTNESQENFNRRMALASFKQRPPISLQELAHQVTSIEEIQAIYKRWCSSKKETRLPSIAIERYQETAFTPTSYTTHGQDKYYHLKIPLADLGSGGMKISGSDNGSLVHEWGQVIGATAGKPPGKILGIVESLSTWSTTDYAVIQPMVFVVEILHHRLSVLFHTRQRR